MADFIVASALVAGMAICLAMAGLAIWKLLELELDWSGRHKAVEMPERIRQLNS